MTKLAPIDPAERPEAVEHVPDAPCDELQPEKRAKLAPVRDEKRRSR